LLTDPIDLGSVTADANGRAAVTFKVPTDLSLGRHTIHFVGAVSGTALVGFEVVGSNAPTINTGGTAASAVTQGQLIGLVLLAFGLAFIAVIRRVRGRGWAPLSQI
jgi:hypothetical protein